MCLMQIIPLWLWVAILWFWSAVLLYMGLRWALVRHETLFNKTPYKWTIGDRCLALGCAALLPLGVGLFIGLAIGGTDLNELGKYFNSEADW